MTEKKRGLGTDPLKEPLPWISKTTGDSKQSLQSKHKLQFKDPRGRKKTATREITKATQIGLQEGWERATVIMRQDYKEKVKAIAYWDRRTEKDVFDEALAEYLKDKKVKPLPERR